MRIADALRKNAHDLNERTIHIVHTVTLCIIWKLLVCLQWGMTVYNGVLRRALKWCRFWYKSCGKLTMATRPWFYHCYFLETKRLITINSIAKPHETLSTVSEETFLIRFVMLATLDVKNCKKCFCHDLQILWGGMAPYPHIRSDRRGSRMYFAHLSTHFQAVKSDFKIRLL